MQQELANSVPNRLDELADIYEFWHTPWWQTKLFYMILTLLAVILLCLIVWQVIRALRSRKKITPWERALHSFQHLKNASYADEKEIAAGYFALRTTLKGYVAVRYSESLLDKTDDELVKELSHSIDQADVVNDIKELLSQSAQVVFAGMESSHRSLANSIEKAISVVKRTVPQTPNK